MSLSAKHPPDGKERQRDDPPHQEMSRQREIVLNSTINELGIEKVGLDEIHHLPPTFLPAFLKAEKPVSPPEV